MAAGQKTFGNTIVLNPQASDPVSAPDGALYYNTATNKIRGKENGTWQDLSGGSSAAAFVGPVNLVVLDTSFEPTKQTNSDAETSVGDWAAYADAAGALPVDATGGSPTVTIARTTTAGEVQNGVASFEVTKDAANRQGEGVSLLVNIPEAYRDTQLTLTMPFEVISGTLVEGDIEWFAYDVTNSQVISMQNGKSMVGSYGQVFALFSVPRNCTQIRLAMHFASTSTSAVNLAFDDVRLEPSRTSIGGITTDWETYTPTFSGLGTVSGAAFYWRRVGDSMEIRGSTTVGTVAASLASVSMPSGTIADSTKISSVMIAGRSWRSLIGAVTGGAYTISSIVDAGGTEIFFGLESDGFTPITKRNGNAILLNGILLYVHAIFPVSGWSSNVTLASSSTFRMSNILANGTRVTGTEPTKLGEYRSYLRNSSSGTMTETNGAPADAPSATNGIRIYEGNAFNVADTNNQPTRYDIFVGKNKHVKLEWYANAGRTGFISVDPQLLSYDIGYLENYDPTTGILRVVANRFVGGSSLHYSGIGTDATVLSDPYFDVIVSENALAVGMNDFTRWQGFSMNITSISGTNPNKGTPATEKAFWRRVGQNMEIRYDLVLNTTGDDGTGQYQFQIPAGFEVDDSYVFIDGVLYYAGIVGSGIVSSSAGNYLCNVQCRTATQLTLLTTTSIGSFSTLSATNFDFDTDGGRISFIATIPIKGW